MNKNTPFPRRDFLKTLGLAGAGIVLGRHAFAEGVEKADEFQIPRRKFGRHDFTVSSLCLGGHTLALAPLEEARKIVDRALEVGLDFFDNAWDYHNGGAEELMGQLIEGRRDKVFLMTKVCSNHQGKGRERAMEMLEESLKRLRTDYLDLWQLHEVTNMEQVESAFAPGGTLEALVEAKKQGKVRYIGFTGHSLPEVHLAMLSRGFEFDSCQLPISGGGRHHGKKFREEVLPEIVRQGIAALGMKTMGGDASLIRDGKLTPKEALGYALSTPVSTVVSGIRRLSELEENARIAATFKPMNGEQMSAVERRFSEGDELRYARYSCHGYRDGYGLQA
jgi:aryl-alcohol dehydrogenase-like predicted oxidoreductase